MIDEIRRIEVIEYDERFYQLGDKYFPSVTYVLGLAYPSGGGLTRWIGDVGNKRAEEIRDEAGEDGSYVHDAIDRMIKGEQIKGEDIDKLFKKSDRILKIKRCLKAFLDFYKEYKPIILSTEFTVVNINEKYAGTVDLKCIINDKEYIIDYKTSKSISVEHKVQLAAYNQADNENKANIAILHLGNTTIKGYSFLEVKEKEQYYNQFNITNKLFQEIYPDAKPKINIFPLEFFLDQTYGKS